VVLKNGIQLFLEKVSWATAIGSVGINRVKKLEVCNIDSIKLTKIASTQINRLRCDPQEKGVSDAEVYSKRHFITKVNYKKFLVLT